MRKSNNRTYPKKDPENGHFKYKGQGTDEYIADEPIIYKSKHDEEETDHNELYFWKDIKCTHDVKYSNLAHRKRSATITTF